MGEAKRRKSVADVTTVFPSGDVGEKEISAEQAIESLYAPWRFGDLMTQCLERGVSKKDYLLTCPSFRPDVSVDEAMTMVGQTQGARELFRVEQATGVSPSLAAANIVSVRKSAFSEAAAIIVAHALARALCGDAFSYDEASNKWRDTTEPGHPEVDLYYVMSSEYKTFKDIMSSAVPEAHTAWMTVVAKNKDKMTAEISHEHDKAIKKLIDGTDFSVKPKLK